MKTLTLFFALVVAAASISDANADFGRGGPGHGGPGFGGPGRPGPGPGGPGFGGPGRPGPGPGGPGFGGPGRPGPGPGWGPGPGGPGWNNPGRPGPGGPGWGRPGPGGPGWGHPGPRPGFRPGWGGGRGWGRPGGWRMPRRNGFPPVFVPIPVPPQGYQGLCQGNFAGVLGNDRDAFLSLDSGGFSVRGTLFLQAPDATYRVDGSCNESGDSSAEIAFAIDGGQQYQGQIYVADDGEVYLEASQNNSPFTLSLKRQ